MRLNLGGRQGQTTLGLVSQRTGFDFIQDEQKIVESFQ